MFRLTNRKALNRELKCKVILLLPGEELEIGYTLDSIGQDLLKSVVEKLSLLDEDYYGLKFSNHKQWLDLSKCAAKQFKALETSVLELKFKYYPAKPALLVNESTRYNLYLQLKSDLNEGRLGSDSQETLAYLIACILQSELGSYNTNSSNFKKYVSEFKFVPDQNEELELLAIEKYQTSEFDGLEAVESELNFLKKSQELDIYGVDLYSVEEDGTHDRLHIGVNHSGISSFQGFNRRNCIEWDKIERLSLDNKQVMIHCRGLDKRERKSKPFYGIKFPAQEYAHNFWKIAYEHRYFFTLESTPDQPIITSTGGLFTKNHKIKFTGRVEKDVLRNHANRSSSQGVKRSHSLMSKTINRCVERDSQQLINNSTNSPNSLSKTLPANIDFHEEENSNEEFNSITNQYPSLESQGISIFTEDDLKKRSDDEIQSKSSETVTDGLITAEAKKYDVPSSRENQVDERDHRRGHDYFKTGLFIVSITVGLVLTILLINDPKRPSIINVVVKKLKLERISMALRENYYLPIKSALRTANIRMLSFLET